MKIFFAAALIAAVGFAKTSVKSMSDEWETGADTTSILGITTEVITSKWGFLKASYDFDFGYNVETAVEQGEATEGVMDSWAQTSLYSSLKLELELNVLGLHACNIRINTTPFKFIPIWASLYYTHPVAVAQGIIDAYGAAIEFGWEYALGDVQVEYWYSNLVPGVSILDYLMDTTDFIVPDFPKFDAKIAAQQGWAQSAGDAAFTADPLLSWSLFEQINEDGSMNNYGSFAFIPLLNDNISTLQ